MSTENTRVKDAKGSHGVQLEPELINTIVCDLDGTLVDSMGDFTLVAQETMQKYFDVTAEEAAKLYRQTSGLPFEFQLKSLFEGHANIDEAVTEFESNKLRSYFDKEFYEDVIQTLPLLKEQGYRLVVSSNNSQLNVEDKMGEYKNHFDMILGYEPGRFKGKDHFDRIQSEFKVAAEQMVFIGDSLHDCKMAFENQIPFVGRVGTFKESDFAKQALPYIPIQNFFEFSKILKKDSVQPVREV